MTTTRSVHTEGADIVYDHEGTGPLLLMISGGGGASEHYARISGFLAEHYTVVRYDRRGNSRSTGDTTVDLDMAQQARDAVAVIRAMGGDEAYVFGNSGGANIALQLAADHPGIIRAMVAHEAPTSPLLPDADAWLAFADRVYGTFTAEGAEAACKVFATELVGFDTANPQQARVAEGEMTSNAEFWLAREYLPLATFDPDLDTIRANKVAMATAAGRESAGAYYARTARIQAERLGCPYVEFPGNHLGFIFEAASFAAALRRALDDLTPATAS
ncbi:alpha/beta fold hydrolase [Nonomuraea roseoviolacea]|uniref:Pimeloyl-ACP methyl ester carboxylesterase n=1 Tax=Nonomuraea roseoviolacea subsp. carminata TaxID=160689 RepID=A0ABT1K0N0_9ACTN|nr:alpha/beta hydrolase [Nonomuraea roseoviolacea]MCP2347550.1 pimeloyl-ACP methyl ester carboxylesterase [Nonomuraea roseoviolacea subsp. carminata]